MAENEELSGEWHQDPVTHYLESSEPGTITPKHKTAFLKALKTHGNQSKAAHDLGFSYKTIALHLRKDLIFKEAFEETLLEMRHKLEGELFKAGMGGKSKEALSWLSAHFRADYGPASKNKPVKPNTDDLDRLYGKLDEE